MIEQTYKLNMIPRAEQDFRSYEPPVVHISQYDKVLRTLRFELYDGEDPFTIPENTAAYIYGMKPDGNAFQYQMDITEDGILEINVQTQMATVAGCVTCEVILFEGNESGNRIGSANFKMAVEKAAVGDDAQFSRSDMPVIQTLLFGGSPGDTLIKGEDGRVRWNSDSPTEGFMKYSEYDPDLTGTVNSARQANNAATVDGHTVARNVLAGEYTNAEIDEMIEAGAGNAQWGQITGTISNQADLTAALNAKQDKEEGKGLSQENFTSAEKSKLANIQARAEVNVQSDWTETNPASDAYIVHKPSIPSKTSDLTNDSGYLSELNWGQIGGTLSHQQDLQNALNAKQGTLTAGPNITIDENNVISAAGGSGGGAVDSVNGKTGVVVLTASDLGAYVKPTNGIPKSDLASAVQTSLNKADTALQSAPVTSVNSKTGAVVLSASDVGAYVKPSAGIPKTDLASAVQTSLEKADTALQSAPVTSVNSKTGAVTLTASDVGALPSTTSIPSKTSDLTNDSGYITSAGAPVQSVNGQTGAVTVPDTDTTYTLSMAGNVITLTPSSGTASSITLPVSETEWGDITGTLANQTDLQSALNAKASVWTVQNMTASDTVVTLNPNVFYIFPEMATLTVTVSGTGMHAFRFTSGATATTLTVNGATMPDSFEVESGKVYEVNVYQGYGVVSEWTA